MPQDKALTFKRLGELWRREDIPVLDTSGKRYFVFSDTHLGDKSGADDFSANEETLRTALDGYRRAGYELILLGDIEEFWQFRLDEIARKYRDTIYDAIKAFGDDRVHRVYGNHDGDWRTLPDPVKDRPAGAVNATEALKMRDGAGATRILLVHGHQGSLESDKDGWSSRFFVRLYRLAEPFWKALGGGRRPPAMRCQIVRDYERILYSWAKQEGVMLLCGHSHRAIFASRSYIERLEEDIAWLKAEIDADPSDRELAERNREEIKKKQAAVKKEKSRNMEIEPAEPGTLPRPCYFNAGCGLYPDGITGLEIADDEIRLAKWHRDPRADPRHEIYQRGSLSGFLAAWP
jgi:predicted phosphodiesterase